MPTRLSTGSCAPVASTSAFAEVDLLSLRSDGERRRVRRRPPRGLLGQHRPVAGQDFTPLIVPERARLEPRYRGLAYTVRPREIGLCGAFREPLHGFPALMGGQCRGRPTANAVPHTVKPLCRVSHAFPVDHPQATC
jgi:hypothetical protein